MALPHAQPGQPVDVGPLGPRLPGEKIVALFKTDQLEVIRLVLPAGRSLPPHKVPGEITIQCVEGRLEIQAEGRSQALAAGQLLYLRGGVVHGVVSLEDASALVTIVLAAPTTSPPPS
jgi:quercetin dioxygenase-like cupin family protein